MNKTDLINAVADAAQLSKAEAQRAVDGVTAAIAAALKNGNSVSLVGFGTFETGQRAERTGRNPKTGEAITIAAAKTVKFKPGKHLKDTVNGR